MYRIRENWSHLRKTFFFCSDYPPSRYDCGSQRVSTSLLMWNSPTIPLLWLSFYKTHSQQQLQAASIVHHLELSILYFYFYYYYYYCCCCCCYYYYYYYYWPAQCLPTKAPSRSVDGSFLLSFWLCLFGAEDGDDSRTEGGQKLTFLQWRKLLLSHEDLMVSMNARVDGFTSYTPTILLLPSSFSSFFLHYPPISSIIVPRIVDNIISTNWTLAWINVPSDVELEFLFISITWHLLSVHVYFLNFFKSLSFLFFFPDPPFFPFLRVVLVAIAAKTSDQCTIFRNSISLLCTTLNY